MVYPINNVEYFCDWLQSVSWIKLTPARLSTVQDVQTAALTSSSVSNITWTNFILSSQRWWIQWEVNLAFNPTTSVTSTVIPVTNTYFFCTFLQSVSWIKLTAPQLSTVQDVATAAINQTTVTFLTWNNFLLSAYKYYRDWQINFAYNKNAVYTQELLDYETYITTPLTPTRRILLNALIIQLQNAGIWNLLDRLWLLASEASDQALISLINPSSTPILPVSSPNFTIDRGYTGNGSSSYLNTKFTPSTDGVNYTLNNAMVAIYDRTNGASALGIEIGVAANSTYYAYIEAEYIDGKIYASINDRASPTLSAANNPNTGLLSLIRVTAASRSILKNGSVLTSDTYNDTNLPTAPLFALCRNENGSPFYYSTHQLALIAYGAGNINQSNFYSIVQAFMTSIGANV